MRFAPIANVLFVALVAGNGPSMAQEAVDRELFSYGMELYLENCAVCHGENGDGKGPLASGFAPRPRDFTTGVFKFKSSEPGVFPAQTDLFDTILHGVEGSYGSMMPRFEHLDIEDLIALTEVIRVAAGTPSYGDLVVAPPRPEPADLTRGAALYGELGCADCHGETGDGRGVLSTELTDAEGLKILPADFRTGQFKGGSDPEEIWMRLYTGMEGTPMPSFARNASGEDLWALVEYVLTFSDDGS